MKIYNYILFGCLIGSSFACSDILNKKDLSAVTEGDVWNDSKYATAYLDKLCRDNLPDWDAGASNNSDEANGGDGIMYGQLTTSSIDTWNYEQIRKINLLLQKVGSGSIDEETQNTLKAQALVLRAWRYFQMVRLYGGVPLILEPQELTDDLYVTRAKTSECIAQMVKDLDDAIAILPWKWTSDDEGRITKAAAMAFKGRILLYWASPQFNPNNDKARWEEAYKVNKQAMEELAQNGYGLYGSYSDLWFDEMNVEAIFVKRFQEPGLVNSWNAGTRPLSEAQNYTGYNRPTLEMVESYPMVDGVPITESKDYDPVYFWKNRDPRFAQSIAYNGCLWELSGKSGRIQWTYVGSELNNPTPSGFYCRKAVDESYTPYYTERSSTDWIEIRYAEVLMNYAECAAELDKKDEAYAILKQIRNRAGILPGSDGLYGLKAGMSHDDMIKAIMLERKIEFAFEGKRYWDLRRRRLFASELNGTRRHGLLPKLKISQEEFDKIKDNVDIDIDKDTYFRDSLVVLDTKFDIDFKDNYYFYAIPNKHLETNSKLEQTQGWDGGTFNPYE